MTEETEEKKELFTVFAEAEGQDKPLILINLTFARLIDDVVIPYEEKKPFIIDGVSITRDRIYRLKILRQKERFRRLFYRLHSSLRRGDKAVQKTVGEQYHVRLEAIIREGCEDVTSQVIKAFDAKIRPRLKDYLPKREELIQAAYQVFIAAMKILSNS
jgi:hypothetical protein